jgi:AcrR family transcriptional regulator
MLTKSVKIDPRVKRTRKLLQESLMHLMRHKTFNAITVQDITEHAEVNRATFYAHFTDKYDLMNYAVREMFYSLVKPRLPENPAFNRANLRVLFLATGEFLSGAVSHCPPSPHEQEHAVMMIQVQTSLRSILLAWLGHEGYIKGEHIATVTSWTIFGAVMGWIRDKQVLPLDQLADQILDILMQGVDMRELF